MTVYMYISCYRCLSCLDEELCQGCQIRYDIDSSSDQECWIGCDFCWRWWHYWCASLTEMPDPLEVYSIQLTIKLSL